MADTIFIGSAKLVLKTLESLKIEPVTFLEDTLGKKVNLDLVEDPYARVKYQELEKVWAKIYGITEDECLGIEVAKLWHPSHLGALGYAWLASSSLNDGFSRIERYIHMISKRIRINITQTDQEYAVVFQRRNIANNLHFLTDVMMAVALNMSRINVGAELCPTRAEFMRPAPACVNEFKNHFRCPLNFNANDNRLVFTHEVINKSLPSADPIVAEASDRIVIEYLARMDDANIVDRVKAQIVSQLSSGKFSEASVADALHQSTRTLQRSLSQENVNFSTIVNEVRKDLAIKYIKDNSLTLTEIAFLLGFSESSAFTRAFKRWHGTAPSRLRA